MAARAAEGCRDTVSAGGMWCEGSPQHDSSRCCHCSYLTLAGMGWGAEVGWVEAERGAGVGGAAEGMAVGGACVAALKLHFAANKRQLEVASAVGTSAAAHEGGGGLGGWGGRGGGGEGGWGGLQGSIEAELCRNIAETFQKQH